MNFQGFYSGEEIEKCFNNIASRKGIKKISDIKMPIVIPTVDVQNSRKYIITNTTESFCLACYNKNKIFLIQACIKI